MTRHELPYISDYYDEFARERSNPMGVHLRVQDIEECMTYQKPDEEQQAQFQSLHEKLVDLGKTICAICPPCDDRDHALRQLRDCRMWANSAIAHKGRY